MQQFLLPTRSMTAAVPTQSDGPDHNRWKFRQVKLSSTSLTATDMTLTLSQPLHRSLDDIDVGYLLTLKPVEPADHPKHHPLPVCFVQFARNAEGSRAG